MRPRISIYTNIIRGCVPVCRAKISKRDFQGFLLISLCFFMSFIFFMSLLSLMAPICLLCLLMLCSLFLIIPFFSRGYATLKVTFWLVHRSVGWSISCLVPFWAAAPKGPMTYAFTQEKFLLLLLHPPPSKLIF